MSLLDDVVALPAEIAAAAHTSRRRLALARTKIAVIVDHDTHFVELAPCDDALDAVPRGLVPVLASHWTKKEGFWLENQLGEVREGRFVDGVLELVIQFNHSALAEQIWRDLQDGLTYGCSIHPGSIIGEPVTPTIALPKPYYHADTWLLRELTIAPATHCRDRTATVRHARNLAELEAELRAIRAVRDEMKRRALPEFYAATLRRRVPAIAAAIAAAPAGEVERTLAAAVERWLADWEGRE